MAITTVPIYSGVVPNRRTQSATDFTNAAVTWTDYQANTLISGINLTISEFETAVAGVDSQLSGYVTTTSGFADDAEDSADRAMQYAAEMQSSVNFKGEWSSLSGSLYTPASVYHNGAFWQLLYDLLDVSASEPGSSVNWAFSSGGSWLYKNTSSTIYAGSMIQVSATVSPVDLTLPNSMGAGEFISIKNNLNSTEQVRVLNNGYTIIGARDTLSTSDNLIFSAGDVTTIICRSTGVLEVL